MFIIAHRGLLDGPNKELENRPDQIEKAIAEGFDVEVDVWHIGSKLWSGHDAPTYELPWKFLDKKELWIHCKDFSTLEHMVKQWGMRPHYFWHQKDDFTLTSNGHIWTYPGRALSEDSVCVLPETYLDLDYYIFTDKECAGVCTDYPRKIKVS
jgi:hypothetical protein